MGTGVYGGKSHTKWGRGGRLFASKIKKYVDRAKDKRKWRNLRVL